HTHTHTHRAHSRAAVLHSCAPGLTLPRIQFFSLTEHILVQETDVCQFLDCLTFAPNIPENYLNIKTNAHDNCFTSKVGSIGTGLYVGMKSSGHSALKDSTAQGSGSHG
ncbi:hypothetical protein H1C71_035052, partial [Ictidomys tridecemlineatus]